MMRAILAALFFSMICAVGLQAQTLSLGIDASVAPYEQRGYLFTIEVLDLTSGAVLAAPKVVTQANQPAEITSTKDGQLVRITAETDGSVAQLHVEVTSGETVVASSRIRLTVLSP
jgi:hypothetical protein